MNKPGLKNRNPSVLIHPSFLYFLDCTITSCLFFNFFFEKMNNWIFSFPRFGPRVVFYKGRRSVVFSQAMQCMYFRQILNVLRVHWQILTPGFASLPDRRNEHIKYLIFSIGNWNRNLSRFCKRTLVLLRQHWSQLIYFFIISTLLFLLLKYR